MKTIPLKIVSETIDVKKGTITYQTDTDTGDAKGIIVLNDESGDHDMLLTRQIHQGGPVVLLTRPFKLPAKKYNVGEVMAHLLLL